jgi:hypothetical protein
MSSSICVEWGSASGGALSVEKARMPKLRVLKSKPMVME